MENIQKTINRLVYFVEYKGVSLNKLAEQIGVSNSYFSKMKKKNASIGSDILEKIVSVYPDLNTNWLLSGQGSMLKDEKKDEKGEGKDSEYKFLIESLQKVIDSQEKIIKALEQQLPKNK